MAKSVDAGSGATRGRRAVVDAPVYACRNACIVAGPYVASSNHRRFLVTMSDALLLPSPSRRRTSPRRTTPRRPIVTIARSSPPSTLALAPTVPLDDDAAGRVSPPPPLPNAPAVFGDTTCPESSDVPSAEPTPCKRLTLALVFLLAITLGVVWQDAAATAATRAFAPHTPREAECVRGSTVLVVALPSKEGAARLGTWVAARSNPLNAQQFGQGYFASRDAEALAQVALPVSAWPDASAWNCTVQAPSARALICVWTACATLSSAHKNNVTVPEERVAQLQHALRNDARVVRQRPRRVPLWPSRNTTEPPTAPFVLVVTFAWAAAPAQADLCGGGGVATCIVMTRETWLEDMHALWTMVAQRHDPQSLTASTIVWPLWNHWWQRHSTADLRFARNVVQRLAAVGVTQVAVGATTTQRASMSPEGMLVVQYAPPPSVPTLPLPTDPTPIHHEASMATSHVSSDGEQDSRERGTLTATDVPRLLHVLLQLQPALQTARGHGLGVAPAQLELAQLFCDACFQPPQTHHAKSQAHQWDTVDVIELTAFLHRMQCGV